jgi:putative transposase
MVHGMNGPIASPLSKTETPYSRLHFPIGLDIVDPVSKEDRSWFHVGRLPPAHGVYLTSQQPVIVWLTVCTKDREPWLTQAAVMETLHAIWSNDATAWHMGDYLIMPDHLHGFCAPHITGIELERWVAYWKYRVTRIVKAKHGCWQRGVFHHRLRSRNEFEEKWRYMMENPLRRSLVEQWQDWPWRGRVHDVTW